MRLEDWEEGMAELAELAELLQTLTAVKMAQLGLTQENPAQIATPR